LIKKIGSIKQRVHTVSDSGKKLIFFQLVEYQSHARVSIRIISYLSESLGLLASGGDAPDPRQKG
jgi:hypothetical protein